MIDAERTEAGNLGSLIDDLATDGLGLIMTMGKGGFGMTTVAAAGAVALAQRDLPVHLTTSDHAAHTGPRRARRPHHSRPAARARATRDRGAAVHTPGRHLPLHSKAGGRTRWRPPERVITWLPGLGGGLTRHSRRPRPRRLVQRRRGPTRLQHRGGQCVDHHRVVVDIQVTAERPGEEALVLGGPSDHR